MHAHPTTAPVDSTTPATAPEPERDPLQATPEQAEEFDRAFAAIFGIRPGALR